MSVRKVSSFFIAAVGLVTAGSVVRASVTPATVTWGTPTNISGDTDATTATSLVAAYHFGTTGIVATTINGVTFAPFVITSNSTTIGNFTLSETPATLTGSNTFGSVAAPFTSLTSNYQALLGDAAYATESETMTLSLGGLVAGHQYQFEWWNNLSNSNAGGESNYATTAKAGNSVTLNPDTTSATGGLGQFDIGTFTATGTIEPILFTGVVGPAINAFELTTSPVPEPASLAVIGIPAAMALLRRRRKFA